jgi:hypothetical protein
MLIVDDWIAVGTGASASWSVASKLSAPPNGLAFAASVRFDKVATRSNVTAHSDVRHMKARTARLRQRHWAADPRLRCLNPGSCP